MNAAHDTRKLLELAAKSAMAAGMKLHKYHNDDDPGEYIEWRIEATAPDGETWHKLWNPRTNDGDSRRLEVALKIDVQHDDEAPIVCARYLLPGRFSQNTACEKYGDDPCAATRLAVLRAAAAIGEAMP